MAEQERQVFRSDRLSKSLQLELLAWPGPFANGFVGLLQEQWEQLQGEPDWSEKIDQYLYGETITD